MKSVICVFILSCLLLDSSSKIINSTCGWDLSPASTVYPGVAEIKTYPWLGMLYYPLEAKRICTNVVLVTRQMVIAAASEIDKLPKTDFRLRTRVVLGGRHEAENAIRVRDYIFHPEYVKHSLSAPAMVQLEIDHLTAELRPICQPPTHFIEPQFYAFTLSQNLKNQKVRIHEMRYVNINECKNFYRRSELGQASIWPVHAACARAASGGPCVWRSGSVLAVRQYGRWRLLGFSVYGPGCGDPARFLDYGMYQQWVRHSSSTIGKPTITRLGDNLLVLRRSLANIQRYGPCDPEEKIKQLYSDRVSLVQSFGEATSKYNVTLHASVEYSCITFTAVPLTDADYARLNYLPGYKDAHRSSINETLPKIHLRRWCATTTGMCHGFQHIEIQFYVDIMYSRSIEFRIHVYGRPAKVLSTVAMIKYTNLHIYEKPKIGNYREVMQLVRDHKKPINLYKWFYTDADL